MPSKLEAMAELERRGKLPVDKQALINEARSRGLIGKQPLTAQEKAHDFYPKQPEPEGERFPLGALAGGTVGAGLGGMTSPVTGPVGPVVGGALGSGLGELMEQLIRGEDIDPTRVGTETALGLGGEVGSRLALKAGGKAFRFLKPRPQLVEGAKEAMDFLTPYMPAQERSKLNPLRYIKGKEFADRMAFLPAEATESRGLDILQNLAEGSIIGGSAISEFKRNRNKALGRMADDIIRTMGRHGDPDAIGNFFVNVVEGRLETARIPAQQLYNTVADKVAPVVRKIPEMIEVDTGLVDAAGKPLKRSIMRMVPKKVGGVKVSLDEAKKFVKPLIETADVLEGIGGTSAGDDLMRKINKIGDTIYVSDAIELRSRLLDSIREISMVNKKAKAIGKTKKLIELVDGSIEKSLRAKNPELLNMWREANQIWKSTGDEMNNRFIKKLIETADKEDGGALVDSILKNKRIGRIQRAKNAVGGIDKLAWKRMQGHFTEKVFEDAINPATGELIGSRMITALKKMGEPALKEIYTPEQLSKVRGFANALKILQAKQGEGTGRMFIQLTQAGAVLSLPSELATGKLKGAAVSILLAPGVMAKIFTNPKASDALINGFTAGGKTKMTAGTLGRFLTDIVNMQFNEKNKTPQVPKGKSFLSALSEVPLNIAPQATRANQLSETLKQGQKMRP